MVAYDPEIILLRDARLFLQEKTTQQQIAFKLWQVEGLDRDMTLIERIPTFSQEEFMMSYPEASCLTAVGC